MIALASLIIGILTYLRVTRKSLPKTDHFQDRIKPKDEKTLFNIEGEGSFQKLEMTAEGSEYSMVTLIIDDNTCLQETFDSLNKKSSQYIRTFIRPSPKSIKGRFYIEIDLPRNFFKNLKFSATNKHESVDLQIKGAVHYNTYRN